VRNSGIFIKLHKFLGANLLRLAYLTGVAAMVMHWLACTFYYVAAMQGEGAQSWVQLAGLEGADK
jgi:hypothetical protein